MSAKPVDLKTRISASIAVMQPATENDCGCAPVKAHSPLLTPSCVDTDGAPASAPVGVQFCTVVKWPTNRGVVWQRDWSKAKLRGALPKAAGSVTSSSFLAAPNPTPNTWPSSVQAGNEDSYRSVHGAIRKIAPTAIWTGCSCSSGKILAIAGSCRSTFTAIPTYRATARLLRTPRTRRLCSIGSKTTGHRPGLTTDVRRMGVAA